MEMRADETANGDTRRPGEVSAMMTRWAELANRGVHRVRLGRPTRVLVILRP
jgi:hypothetical protein